MVVGENGICRFSVSRFSFSSIMVNSALCASKILVISFALLSICSIVVSILSILVVTVPRACATPIADATASALRVTDFSLLILIESRRCWTFRGMLDSRRVISLDLFDAWVLSSHAFFGLSLVDLLCRPIRGYSCAEKIAWVVQRSCHFGGFIWF